MEALLHQRSVVSWVELGNVGSNNRLFRGSSGCIQGPIQRMPSRTLDGSQRLNAWASSSKRSCGGSANAQRAMWAAPCGEILCERHRQEFSAPSAIHKIEVCSIRIAGVICTVPEQGPYANDERRGSQAELAHSNFVFPSFAAFSVVKDVLSRLRNSKHVSAIGQKNL